MNRLPIETIDILKKFIEENNLGPIKTFYAGEKPGKNYNELEKSRLKNLINLCEKFETNQISIQQLEKEIENSLQISNVLATDIAQKIETAHTESSKKSSEETTISSEKPQIENKKSLFSVLVNEKK